MSGVVHPGWRAFALVAALGWVATAGAWWTLSGTTSEGVVHRSSADPARRAALEGSRRVRRVAQGQETAPTRTFPLQASSEALDEVSVREAIREEVLAELEAERRARRAARGERILGHLMDRVGAFGDEHGLDEATRAELESAMVDMHGRMEELHGGGPPPGPPPPGGPPEEMLEAMREALAALEADAGEALQDEELTALFVEDMKPPPLRGPGGPGGPPPPPR